MEGQILLSVPRRKFLKWLVPSVFGLLLVGWLRNTPAGLLGKADAIGYAVCHRIDIRSFHLGDRPISLCARCTGMYLGAVLALLVLSVFSPRGGGLPTWPVWGVSAGIVLAFGIDGLNSFAHLIPGAPSLYEPNNTLRLVTGTGFGLLLGTATFVGFNQSVWRRWDPRPILKPPRQLLGLLAMGGVVILLVLSENPLILYPLALISAAGVLAILTLIYTMLWLVVLKAENRFDYARQLWLPLVGGLSLAILQISALDFIRFWLTGTWEGFQVILGG